MADRHRNSCASGRRIHPHISFAVRNRFAKATAIRRSSPRMAEWTMAHQGPDPLTAMRPLPTTKRTSLRRSLMHVARGVFRFAVVAVRSGRVKHNPFHNSSDVVLKEWFCCIHANAASPNLDIVRTSLASAAALQPGLPIGANHVGSGEQTFRAVGWASTIRQAATFHRASASGAASEYR
jgi:hypothetical protein